MPGRPDRGLEKRNIPADPKERKLHLTALRRKLRALTADCVDLERKIEAVDRSSAASGISQTAKRRELVTKLQTKMGTRHRVIGAISRTVNWQRDDDDVEP